MFGMFALFEDAGDVWVAGSLPNCVFGELGLQRDIGYGWDSGE